MFKFLNADKEIDTLAEYADNHDINLEEVWALTKPILNKCIVKGCLGGLAAGAVVLIAINQLSKFQK